MKPLVSLALLVLCPTAYAEVLHVDATGRGDYTAIQPAVDAAAEGDTIIVHGVQGLGLSGAPYDGFTVTGKSLTMVGEGFPQGDVGPSVVQGLVESQVVPFLDMGFNAYGPWASSGGPIGSTDGPGLTIDSCAGSVRLQGCVLGGSTGVRAWAALQINASKDVTVVDSTARGARELSAEVGPSSAVQVINSRLVAFKLTAAGGDGAFYNGPPARGGDGAPGAVLAGRSFLWLGDSTLEGGRGGGGCIYACEEYPGDGGVGLLAAPGSVAFHSESALVGGDAGDWTGGFGQPGSPGLDSVGTVIDAPGTHAEISCAPFTRAGSPLDLVVHGVPGESVSAVVARKGGLRFLGGARGVLCASDFVDPSGFVNVGTIPASGVLEVSLAMPPAAAGVLAHYEVQVLLTTGPGAFRLSMTRTVAVLGDGVELAREGYRRYVDPAAPDGGDGRSWGTALNDLQVALDDCLSPTDGFHEVWLKEGRHVPGDEYGFWIPPSTRLLGGFRGQEVNSSERDPAANVTVIDGDLGGNDAAGIFDDNTLNLLTHASYGFFGFEPGDVELDGLRIRGSSNPQSRAAIHSSGDIVVRRCTVEESRGGSSIRISNANLLLERTRIFGHVGGAAVQVSASTSSPARVSVRSSEIYGNWNSYAAAPFFYGGAIMCVDALALDIENSTIVGNRSEHGFGAIVTYGTQSVRIANSIVQGNTAPAASGGLSNGVFVELPASLSVDWNAIEGLDPSHLGAGNLTAPVTFADVDGADNIPGNEDDDLSLVSGSVGVDAGNSDLVTMGQWLDLLGGIRIKDDPATVDTGVGSPRVVDMGAHER